MEQARCSSSLDYPVEAEAWTSGSVEEQALQDEKPLSKRQQKKLLKKEATKQSRAERKKAKKAQDKLKAAAKRKEMDERMGKMSEAEREEYRQRARAAGLERIQNKARQKQRLDEALVSGQHIIIDLDFGVQMTKEQVTSLCQQLSFCHSVNAAAEKPVHLEFTSMAGTVGKALRAQVSGVENWPITMTDCPYIDKFSDRKSQLVYLSADSQDTLEELSPSKSYIIGGLVDRNRYKGLCESKAKEQGIATTSLPISDYACLTGNKVLTVNQVLEMLVHWVGNKDWSTAISKALPKRKLHSTKQDNPSSPEESPSEAEMQRLKKRKTVEGDELKQEQLDVHEKGHSEGHLAVKDSCSDDCKPCYDPDAV